MSSFIQYTLQGLAAGGFYADLHRRQLLEAEMETA